MKKKDLKSEKDFIELYKEKGYTQSYRIVETLLQDVNTKEKYNLEDIYIVAEHRFEGTSNPSDMSILYLIETTNGSKGSVLANYSPASDTEMAEFFTAVPKENVSQKANIFDIEK